MDTFDIRIVAGREGSRWPLLVRINSTVPRSDGQSLSNLTVRGGKFSSIEPLVFERGQDIKAAVDVDRRVRELPKWKFVMSNAPVFRSLDEVVLYLSERLERGLIDEIADGCLAAFDTDDRTPRGQLDPPRDYRMWAISALAGRHASIDLRTVYSGRELPRNKSTLTLGGHASELGHVHVDLEKFNEEWMIRNIWLCR